MLLETILATTLLAAAATPPVPAVEERVQARLVSVPVRLHDERPGGCADLLLSAIEIREDGESVGVTYLDPLPLVAMHALLVDAGPAMVDSLQSARRTARAYVESLPSEDPVLLAAFDHRLLLHAPWSTNRARFGRAVDWIEPGARSYLWEAMRELIRSFGSYPGRKVLIVLTRGCDTQGAGGVTAEDVLAAAVQAQSLSIFPIGIAVPARCETSGVDPLPALRTIAERTGGELRTVDAASQLEPVLRSIRDRIGSERLVAFVPRPFGEGRRDEPDTRTARWRELGARLGESAPCRVTIAGTPTRCESAPDATGCAGAPDSPDVPGRPFVLGHGLDSLTGSVRDVVHDGGVVAPSLDELLGDVQADSTSEPRVETRVVSAWIPAVEAVVRTDASPADVVEQAMARVSRFSAPAGSRPAEAQPNPWFATPFLVNGETLLRIRGMLARALAAHPDYLAWATERARQDRVAEVDAVLRTVPAGGQRDLLERARAAIAQAPLELDARETESFLGAWLGDLPAAGVFQTGETWLARQLLAAARGGEPSRLAGAWAEVERMWDVLVRWIPPAGDVRLLGWMVPGYDPDRRVVGYYRVIPARPYSAEILDRFVNASSSEFLGTTGIVASPEDLGVFDYVQLFHYCREAPLGARFLHWMLEQPEVARLLAARYDVRAVRYGHSDYRDLAPVLTRAKLIEESPHNPAWPARQVWLLLGRRDSGGPTLAIGAYFAPERRAPRAFEPEPLCLVVSDRVESEADAELLRALATAPRRFPCILR